MRSILQVVILLLSSYLIGAIPFGLIVSRLKGIDVRRHGSGNFGATNVGRVLGRKWGVLVLLLDAAKGFAVTHGAGRWIFSGSFPPDGEANLSHAYLFWIAAGFACVVGNVAPIYLGFRGGKGVATSLGVILGIWPYLTWPGACALAAWGITVRGSRYVSLASIVAALTMPAAFLAIAQVAGWSLSVHWPFLLLCVVLAGLVIYRHRGNIVRILNGTENRVGAGDKAS